METKHTVDFQPLGRRVTVVEGTTLLEAARQAGVGLSALCGGLGRCGTCRVRVVSGLVTPATAAELEALAEGARLACQTRVLGDVRIGVPPSSISTRQRTQIQGQEQGLELDPAGRAFVVDVTPPSLADLRADATRLREALRDQHAVVARSFDSAALSQLPGRLRDNAWRVQVVVREDEILSVMRASAGPLGFAADMGTTKIAATW